MCKRRKPNIFIGLKQDGLAVNVYYITTYKQAPEAMDQNNESQQ